MKRVDENVVGTGWGVSDIIQTDNTLTDKSGVYFIRGGFKI